MPSLTKAELTSQRNDLLAVLERIREGSSETGRWLNLKSQLCEEGDPEASWVPYSESEQTTWIASVHEAADRAIKKVTAPKESRHEGQTPS